MSVMICSQCGQSGIYWKNLGGLSPWTFCPTCNQACSPLEEEIWEDEDGPNTIGFVDEEGKEF